MKCHIDENSDRDCVVLLDSFRRMSLRFLKSDSHRFTPTVHYLNHGLPALLQQFIIISSSISSR
jgi:hypothetical protein